MKKKRVFPASIGLLTYFFGFITGSLPLLPPSWSKNSKSKIAIFSHFWKKWSFFLVKTVKKIDIFDQLQAKMTFPKFFTVLANLTRKMIFDKTKNHFQGSNFTSRIFPWTHFVRGRLYFLVWSKVGTTFLHHFWQNRGVWKKWHPPKSHQNRSTRRKKGQIDSNLVTLGPYDSDAWFWYAGLRKWQPQTPCGAKKSPKIQKCRFFNFFEKKRHFSS